MVTLSLFKQLALSFEETEEAPHFENTAFKIKKKIFATLNPQAHRATLKFSEIDQSVFSTFDTTIIYPVPNKWGKQGWTHVELDKVNEETLKDALTTAYCQVAPARLAAKYKSFD